MVSIVLSSALAVLVVMLLGAVASRMLNRYAIVDVIWAVAFTAASLTALVVSFVQGVGDPWRSFVLAVLVTAWGVRLGVHLGRRTATASSDDERYLEFMGGAVREVPFIAVLSKIYLLQGVLVMVVGYGVFVAMALPMVWPAGLVVGVAVWAVGVVVEAIADAQLAHFKSKPPMEREPVLSSGLWSWSRHPNYFGEAVIWWGIWCVAGAASGWLPALITLPAPIVLTLIVTKVSGVRIAERRMLGRPGWAEYAARTSIFVPLPPRR